jgi:hypothetical protein
MLTAAFYCWMKVEEYGRGTICLCYRPCRTFPKAGPVVSPKTFLRSRPNGLLNPMGSAGPDGNNIDHELSLLDNASNDSSCPVRL